MIIIGKKINLRNLKDSDDICMRNALKQKCISKYMSRIPYPYKLKHARDFIKKYKKDNNKRFSFAIEDKKTRELIGLTSLGDINKNNKSATLGYWLGKKYWGTGIMTEVVNLVTKYAFKNLKLVRIQASVMHPNTSSMNVLLKNGFQLEGILRKKVYKDKKWLDVFIFGLLKEDFKNSKKLI